MTIREAYKNNLLSIGTDIIIIFNSIITPELNIIKGTIHKIYRNNLIYIEVSDEIKIPPHIHNVMTEVSNGYWVHKINGDEIKILDKKTIELEVVKQITNKIVEANNKFIIKFENSIILEKGDTISIKKYLIKSKSNHKIVYYFGGNL